MNRPDRVGVALSIIIPVVLVGLANLLAYATGWGEEDPAYAAVAFAPPGWVVGAVWMVIFPMWGYARWRAFQAGTSGRRESWWAAALIAWSLSYPIVVLFLDTTGSAAANVFSLALAAVVARRLWTVSKVAAGWVLPSLAWLGFASFYGFAAVATGV
jgi:tryptophan-rich sensory protein